MSFVIGEAKRELNFYQNQNRTVGPNVGPGSYYTPQRYNSVENKVPFGSGSRRKLQAPFMEFFQDMQQFIFLQPKQFQNQTMGDGKKTSPSDREFNRNLLHKQNRTANQVSQERLSKGSTIKSVNQTQIVKPLIQSQQAGNAKSLNNSSLGNYTSMPDHKKKKKQKSSNNLHKILGLLNIKKGSVSIQAQKVRVLEEEEEERDEDRDQVDGSFFVTQEKSKQDKPKTTNIRELKDDLVKAVNMSESMRQRLDKGIVQWKKEDTSKKVGFVKDIMNKKSFMKDIGPGTYDTNQTNEVHVDYKHNPTSNFISNTLRLQEMNFVKNQQKVMKDTQFDLNQNSKKELENSFLGVNKQLDNQTESKKRSISQIAAHNESSFTQGSQFKIFKNGKIKESPTKDQLSYYREQESKLLLKNPNPNVRFELVQKNQYQHRNIGPGTYNLNSTQNTTGALVFGQAERFYDHNKKIQQEKKLPGPGEYSQKQEQQQIFISRNLNNTFMDNSEINEKKYNTHSLFGPFRIPEQHSKKRFLSTQARELGLVNQDSIEAPGPGAYNLNQEDLNYQIQQLGDKELARAYFHIKQSSVFQSKGPRTMVFNQGKDKHNYAYNQYYDNHTNTISKSQLDIVSKRLDKINHSHIKENPHARPEFNLSSQIIDTFQTVDQRFKEDKRLLEMSNIGPGAYQEEYENKVKNQTVQNKKQQSSMFKSSVPRIDAPVSQRDTTKIVTKTEEQSFIGNKSIVESEKPEKLYSTGFEKKSFNVKYGNMGVGKKENKKNS